MTVRVGPPLRRHARILFGMLAAGLLVWALRGLNLQEVGTVLARLSLGKILFLICINLLIFLTFAARWWLFLAAQGYPLPFLKMARYRLIAFGISYFTPGPQFGGEPYQVYAIRRNHRVPVAVALSSVTLDKLIELSANFSFLLVGVALLGGSGRFPLLEGFPTLPVVAGMLSLPLGYLLSLRKGWAPVTRVFRTTLSRPSLPRRWTQLIASIESAETQISRICRNQPLVLALAMGLSIISWIAMVGEFWLALRFLGLPLELMQAIALLTAARIAFLLPMPGGIGTLEAGQVLAMGVLGIESFYGVGISVLIRVRDVLFGAAGLSLEGFHLRRSEELASVKRSFAAGQEHNPTLTNGP